MLLTTYFFLIIWPKSTLDRSAKLLQTLNSDWYWHSIRSVVLISLIGMCSLKLIVISLLTIYGCISFYQITYVCKNQFNFQRIFVIIVIIMHMLIRGMWVGCNTRVKYSHNLHNSVQIIFFPDQINIMQYFYLLNVSFSIFQACLLHWGHHMCASRENYENKSKNYLIVGF